MPSVEEWLDGVLDFAVRSLEHECAYCEGKAIREESFQEPGRCGLCDGTGKARHGDRFCALCKGEGEMPQWGTRMVPCPAAECDKGTVRVHPYSAMAQTGVLNACIGAIVGAREEANFDRMNRVIDWANAYCMAVAAHSLQSMKDDPSLADAVKGIWQQAGDVVPRERGVKFAPSPLTVEELRELGIEPE